jgi:hypothetical protein
MADLSVERIGDLLQYQFPSGRIEQKFHPSEAAT